MTMAERDQVFSLFRLQLEKMDQTPDLDKAWERALGQFQYFNKMAAALLIEHYG